jgi:hypothetical protein
LDSDEFRKALGMSYGELWIVMHSYYARSGAPDADLIDLQRHQGVEEAAAKILTDKAYAGPLLLLEDRLGQAVVQKGVNELTEQSGKNVFLGYTDEKNQPVLPSEWSAGQQSSWPTYISYLRRQGVNRVNVAGMFLRKDGSGCVGNLIKALEQGGIEVIISDNITPATKEDFIKK